MKSLIAVLGGLALAVAAQAQTPAPAPTSTPKETSGKTNSAKAAPEAATKKADPAKKTEPAKKAEPKIDGVVVSRGDKGFLGVQIVNGTFKITFHDVKKNPIAPDVARAVLRWDPKYKVGQDRVVLNPGEDGKSLSSPRSIRPPYQFKLFIVLLKQAGEGEDPAAETHVIDFKA